MPGPRKDLTRNLREADGGYVTTLHNLIVYGFIIGSTNLSQSVQFGLDFRQSIFCGMSIWKLLDGFRHSVVLQSVATNLLGAF